SVVGTPAQFTMHAQLVTVGSHRSVNASADGNANTLLATVDKLVAQLLSLQAGENAQRLELLTTTSLPALRAYLDAQSAFRSGHFGHATEQYQRALDFDSTFVLAAMGQY